MPLLLNYLILRLSSLCMRREDSKLKTFQSHKFAMCSCKTSSIHLVHLAQMDFQKTSPGVPNGFGVSGRKNRGKAFQQNSEQFKDDWERVIFQSCLMSQDQGNQWNRSESSLDLVFPEFEPWADSLWTDFPVILVWKVHPLWTSFRKANLFHSSITLRVLVRVSWRVWTEHPHTSHFLKSVCTHFSVARDIGSMCHAHVIHVSSCVWLCVWSDTLLRLSTLCFPPSLSFSPSTSMWVGSMRSTSVHFS